MEVESIFCSKMVALHSGLHNLSCSKALACLPAAVVAPALGRFENQKFSIFLKSQADLHVAHKNKASQYKILP